MKLVENREPKVESIRVKSWNIQAIPIRVSGYISARLEAVADAEVEPVGHHKRVARKSEIECWTGIESQLQRYFEVVLQPNLSAKAKAEPVVGGGVAGIAVSVYPTTDVCTRSYIPAQACHDMPIPVETDRKMDIAVGDVAFVAVVRPSEVQFQTVSIGEFYNA